MSFSIDSTSSHTAVFCPSRSGENKSDHSVVQSTKKDPADVLSVDLMRLIFSRLSMSSLAKCCQVSRTWRSLAGDDHLWRNFIYRKIAFSNKDWARCFGPEVVANENCREEFDSLPWQAYIEDSRKFHELFPEKSGKDHLMLVRLPKTLTAARNEEGELVGGLSLNSLGRLAKKFFPENENDYMYICDRITHELGDRPLGDRSYWVLMTKGILKGSRTQPYSNQQKLVADLSKGSLPHYEVPGTLEAATCILSQYFSDSKTRLFSGNPKTYTRCKESVQDCQIVAGSFIPAGLCVDYYCVDNFDVGVAALRKF